MLTRIVNQKITISEALGIYIDITYNFQTVLAPLMLQKPRFSKKISM